MKDLYKTLGVAENADDKTIKKAYRKLAKEYHPDVTGDDRKKTERFKEINDAYGVLGDAQKRREYDRLKRSPVRADGNTLPGTGYTSGAPPACGVVVVRKKSARPGGSPLTRTR